MPSAKEGSGPALADWSSVGEQLNLVLERSRFEAMLAEAARWADEITLCLTAPDSQHGSLPWWSELLARSAKCASIQVRRPDQAEGWLLHRLHDTGALRVSAPGGKQVASNLLLFSRAEELRGLFSHLSLERAAAGAAFGTLLAFRGNGQSDLARAARAQADSWSQRSSIPTGSEIDALVRAAGRRRAPLPVLPEPSDGARILADGGEIQRALERLLPGAELELGSGWSARLRSDAGAHQIQLLERDSSRAPFLLTLHAGECWAAGNALLLESPEQELTLVWRGGLLGASRSKQDLLWAETRLGTYQLRDAALGADERVQLVAKSGAGFATELAQFARESVRLGSLFDAEPPPALAHQLSDFAALAPRQQTRIVWKALLGLGVLALEDAVVAAARALRDQGYLQPADLAP
ncbi:MAG TPA: hypothetical protein VG963_19510, partial [Polyangiaceae bacterium]|nr:hypothetical protein [Polyangiaceae bacterium]